MTPRQSGLVDPNSLYSTFKTKYRNDPAGFVEDCIIFPSGQGPTGYQLEILRDLAQHQRESARGPHGLGKSALAAWAVLWFALTRDGEDWKIPTTASAWRQLTKYLWPEIHKWARRLNWKAIGRSPFTAHELLTLNLKLSTGEAFAVASDNAELIEGAHADCLLYIFDESKAIPAMTWDAAEGALSTGDCYALSISTPGDTSGRFYEIQSRKPGFEDWHVRRVTLVEAIRAGRISVKWAKARKRQWGKESALYQNRVLGEFATSDADGIIPLSWVEAANERWLAWKDAGGTLPAVMSALGVDVARFGEDATIRAPRYGQLVPELERTAKEDTMQTTGRVALQLRAHGGVAVVDVIGIGAGPVDRLREQGFVVIAFNAAARTEWKDRSGELEFVNLRAAGWWNLREILDPANREAVALPPDDKLVGDLTTPHWRVQSGGKIIIESKEEIHKRLGRSTDDGDAVMMAFADQIAGNTTWLIS